MGHTPLVEPAAADWFALLDTEGVSPTTAGRLLNVGFNKTSQAESLCICVRACRTTEIVLIHHDLRPLGRSLFTGSEPAIGRVSRGVSIVPLHQ